ncbi:MAG: hypothetical protein Q4E24_08360 [bacterium]|nr:hypothetical protein [bacterium]
MGVRTNMQKKMIQLTGDKADLNRKALKIKRSLDDVNKVLDKVGKKDRKSKGESKKEEKKSEKKEEKKDEKKSEKREEKKDSGRKA